MKRLLLLVCVICATQALIAQQVPQGMKYQAVARDNDGEVMAEQQINLQVSLHSDVALGETYYVEEHVVTTNKLGLFTLDIGSGDATTGVFEQIPWSNREVWMQVSVSSSGSDRYTIISDSRMLSVPYAFHAATASKLVEQQEELSKDDEEGDSNRTPDPGSDSNNWHTDGNTGTDPTEDFLGTSDTTDLVIITAYEERIRVLSDGDVLVANSQRVGKDLEVRNDVNLNTTGGETKNYGDLTVMDQSSTLLSGTLTVDQGTDLNSSLNVDGQTDLNSSLDVNNASPTHLTGTLLVDGIASFSNTTQSTNRSNGGVVIAGGVGVDSNLNVGGNFDVRGTSSFGGPVGFESVVTISDETQSTNTGNGALIVFGGTGIGKNINVGENADIGGTMNVVGATTLNNTLDVTDATTLNGATQVNSTFTVGPHASNLGGSLGVTGATTLSNTLDVTGATTMASTLGVAGVTTISNSTNSTAVTNGALVVNGGVGIGQALNVGGAMKLNNTFELTTTGSLATADAKTGLHVAKFTNTADGSGIAIQVGASTPHNNNNFITFLRADGQEVGRIEGEDGPTDLANNREYNDDIAFKQTAIALSATGEAIAIAEEIQAIVEVTASATSVTVCTGFGICVTAPITSWIVSSAANLVVQTANLILQTADLATVIADLAVFEATHEALFGITFASGAEDYAEYLPKFDPNETFLKGDVVGMTNGYISRNTMNADRIMVISHNPAVLGGLPPETDKREHEMVAFMGQIPTRIMGPAEPGDYILPSGFHNGFGIARNPKDMLAEDYKKVLGVAWERAEGIEMNIINVAVGLNTNDLADLVAKQVAQLENQEELISDLQKQINATNVILAQLVPGFKEAAGIEEDIEGVPAMKASEWQDALALASQDGYHHHPHDRSSEGDIIYYEVTDEELEAGFKMAEETYIKYGVDLSTHPFWKRIKEDPSYKDEVKRDMRSKLKHAMHTHQELNHDLNHD